jgi:hypothetical protein
MIGVDGHTEVVAEVEEHYQSNSAEISVCNYSDELL